ncbi:MAG: prepilin peptidase dependent protein type pilus assembly protein PilA [Candidatus Nomurabacteria bacterium]|nr:prepilin peptidase dependent protein type pilus assembly protein PilA [Candidatus Nomurabacteria bacterium]
MKKTLNKGFTLIELLVVIAIIGILASVILASLNTARAKGADAASKADLSNARAQAEIYYDNQVPNGYANVCTTAISANGIVAMITDAASKSGTTVGSTGAAGSPTTTVCHDSAIGWAAAVPLKSVASTYFCVDSTGAAKQTTTALPASAVVCS